MSCYIKINHPEFGATLETNEYLANQSEIEEFLFTNGYPFEILDNFEFNTIPLGAFDLFEVYEYIEQEIKMFAEREFKTCIVASIECVDNEIKQMCEFNIYDLICKCVSEELTCEKQECLAAGYIGECLYAFVQNGVWQYEYDENEKPLVAWFGVPGEKPIRKWTLEKNKDSSLLHLDSDYDTLKYLVYNSHESFEIWYLAECGCYVPNIAEILGKCCMNS